MVILVTYITCVLLETARVWRNITRPIHDASDFDHHSSNSPDPPSTTPSASFSPAKCSSRYDQIIAQTVYRPPIAAPAAVMDPNYHQPTPTPRPPAPASTLPIAQISPSLEHLGERSICAVVTLVWPYSSATKSLSLLLAEPDFRLRRLSGQVKVVFHGPVAEKVAKTQVGIGDEVSLSLAGSRLDANNAAGNCVAWDVHFDGRMSLEVLRSRNFWI
jgi:hypothetical protein